MGQGRTGQEKRGEVGCRKEMRLKEVAVTDGESEGDRGRGR